MVLAVPCSPSEPEPVPVGVIMVVVAGGRGWGNKKNFIGMRVDIHMPLVINFAIDAVKEIIEA